MMAAARSGRGKSSESRAEIEMSFEQVLLQSGRGVGTTANRLGHSRSIKALLKSRANINYSDYKGDRESARACLEPPGDSGIAHGRLAGSDRAAAEPLTDSFPPQLLASR